MIKTSCKLQNANFIFAFFILIFTFCIVREVYAHKVNIYAYAENGMIHSESYFVDGTKCKNSIVEVFDKKSGTKLLEGKTDEDGKLSFKIPKITTLKLVLHASIGHCAEYTISEEEVKEAMGARQPAKLPEGIKKPGITEIIGGIGYIIGILGILAYLKARSEIKKKIKTG